MALARRLAIALWRYLEHGEIPSGAVLKTMREILETRGAMQRGVYVGADAFPLGKSV